VGGLERVREKAKKTLARLSALDWLRLRRHRHLGKSINIFEGTDLKVCNIEKGGFGFRKEGTERIFGQGALSLGPNDGPPRHALELGVPHGAAQAGMVRA